MRRLRPDTQPSIHLLNAFVDADKVIGHLNRERRPREHRLCRHMTPYTVRHRVDLADLLRRTVTLKTCLDITRLILGCILVRVVTRHAAELVIALDKALALRQTIRLKTVRYLLGQLVELCNSLRCAVALATGVIDNLATLVRKLVQQQPTGFVPSRHRLCMRSTRPVTRLTPNAKEPWLRN